MTRHLLLSWFSMRRRTADGKRYRTQLYSLDMILAIGYRVKSPRGTQFRQWATTHLKEYLIKGSVVDDESHQQTSAASPQFLQTSSTTRQDCAITLQRFNQEPFRCDHQYRSTLGR